MLQCQYHEGLSNLWFDNFKKSSCWCKVIFLSLILSYISIQHLFGLDKDKDLNLTLELDTEFESTLILLQLDRLLEILI